MKKRAFARIVAWLTTLALLLGTALGRPAQADGNIVELDLMAEDHTQFPQITLDVRALGNDDTSSRQLSASSFAVHEDGADRPVDEVSEQSSGIQVAVILDLAGNIDKAGASGRSVRDEAIEVAQQLFQDPSPLDFAGQTDQAMLIVPTGEESFDVKEEWTTDYGRLYNASYAFLGTSPPPYTPLYSMLVEAMARMKEVPGYEDTPSYVVVLSDGVDRTSVEEISDVISRAEALGVQILSVKIGPENLGDAANLRRMASMTNGVMQAYTGPGSVESVWQALGNRRTYYRLTYTSQLAKGGVHSVRVSAGTAQSDQLELNLDLRPPSVTITDPQDGIVIDRIAGSWDQDPSSIDPQDLPVGIRVDFPDGRSRSVTSLTYLVNGAIMATLPPDQGYTWDLRGLDSGTYTLLVRAQDQFGLVGESEPVNVRVNLSIPPAPTATPVPIPTPIIDEKEAERIVITNYALIAGIVLLSVAVLYLWIKRPPAVQKITKAVGDTILQTLRGAPKAPGARAYLVRLDGTGAEIRRHPVARQALNIGRSDSRADLLFEEPTVSGLHAQLAEETDGVFVLRDEGSTNGTFVNLEPVSAAGVTLKSGDMIHLCPEVILRFEQEGDQTVPERELVTDETDIPDHTVVDVSRPEQPSDDGRRR
jgi:pSer/pThr/pTyr-binding forkhead associated (FHA) protein